MPCDRPHRYDEMFEALPIDQGGRGRHRCAGCAYEAGFEAGRELREAFVLDLDGLPRSQGGTVRHKSPHAAFALGYLHGVLASYNQ